MPEIPLIPTLPLLAFFCLGISLVGVSLRTSEPPPRPTWEHVHPPHVPAGE